MCVSEFELIELVSGYRTGSYIPLRLWREDLPEDVEIKESIRGIKTGGEYREVDVNNLICSGKVVKKQWKFEWRPSEFKLENGFLWGKVPENYLGIFHFSDNNRPLFTVCSETIELKDKVVQGLGLLEGEMIRSKTGKSGQYLSFSNMKPDLVNLAIEAFNELGISLHRMRVQPIINTKSEDVEKQEVIDYWTSNTPFSEKHFVSIYRDSRYETQARYGSINLKVYDKIARNILENLIKYVKESNDEEKIREFLRGLFAAEGSVNLSPQNRINHVSLGVKDLKLRNEYRELLQKVGIRPGGNIDPVSKKKAQEKGLSRGRGGFFMVQGLDNFQEFLEHELLNLYPEKQLLLLIGLKNRPTLEEDLEDRISTRLEKLKSKHRETYEEIQERLCSLTERDREVLSVLTKLGEADRSQIAEELNIKPSSASRRMRSLYQKDKVERSKQGRKIIWTPHQD